MLACTKCAHRTQREETWMMVKNLRLRFLQAHAATYADISYRMAYRKRTTRRNFWRDVQRGAGFITCRRMWRKRSAGASRRAAVGESFADGYTAEDGGDGKRALRVGLMAGARAGVETITRFCGRAAKAARSARSKIFCGAFSGAR